MKHRAALKNTAKLNARTTSKHQHGVREHKDLSIKLALNKIDLSKLRENVSEPDDYGI